jgi:hypothetical protein
MLKKEKRKKKLKWSRLVAEHVASRCSAVSKQANNPYEQQVPFQL